MKLYYTNASKPDESQDQANKSLGGYVSDSLIPNDFFANVFSNFSLLDLSTKNSETYLLALKNTLGKNVDDVILKFTIPDDSKFVFKFAAVTPTYNSCADPEFEKIPNSTSKPMSATFNNVVSGTKYNIGDLNNTKFIGIWLRREFDEDKVVPKTCEELEEDYNNNVSESKQETISLEISWSDDQSLSVSESASNSESASQS